MKWNGAADGVEKFGGVVADAGFEDVGHFADIGDLGGGVAVNDDEVCLFAGGDRADAVLPAEEFGGVGRGDPDGFDRGEAAFD